MSDKFKPMLSGKAELSRIQYPVLVSPKLDGVRALIRDGKVMSRSLKEIPNRYVQELYGDIQYEGLDGELIVGSPTDHAVYRNTSSAAMSKDGRPDVTFYVFDNWMRGEETFWSFLQKLPSHLSTEPVPGGIQYLPQYSVMDETALLAAEEALLAEGFEGIMIRSEKGPYKCGRSTLREGYLLKLKRFEDSEAEILAIEELMHNNNEAKTNELGNTARSHHKINLVAGETLGKMLVRDLKTGMEFRIGTGFTAEQRQTYWNNRESLVGKYVKYKYFPVGVKELPRHPVFLGFRKVEDM